MSAEFLSVILEPIKTNLELTIITAGDKKYFTALQTLIASIKGSHNAEIIVFDLGLTVLQRKWLSRQGVKLVKISSNQLFINKRVHFWQTWNKPLYFIKAAALIKARSNKKLLWIDADCIITGSLKWVCRNLDTTPVIFSDTAAILCANNDLQKAKKVIANSDELYNIEKYKVPERCSIDSYPNAGVIGLNLSNKLDNEILHYWSFMVKEANKNSKLLDKKQIDWEDQRWLKWYDQGALQWAIEKCNATHKIINDDRFNNSTHSRFIKDYKNTVRVVGELKKDGRVKILHFLAGIKPYKTFPKKFNPDVEKYLLNRKDIKILVLGHKHRKRFSSSEKFLQYVHLPDIDKDNDLAETRIFKSDILLKYTGYIGLATAQWNTKYKNRCLKLNQLNILPMQISKVWAACKSGEHWIEYTENIHKGMGKYLEYLIQELNIDPYKEVPWSNNFIAHSSVVKDLQSWIWHCYSLLYCKFGNKFEYGIEGFDESRTGSYLAERISMLFFCMRNDLNIEQIPNKICQF